MLFQEFEKLLGDVSVTAESGELRKGNGIQCCCIAASSIAHTTANAISPHVIS